MGGSGLESMGNNAGRLETMVAYPVGLIPCPHQTLVSLDPTRLTVELGRFGAAYRAKYANTFTYRK